MDPSSSSPILDVEVPAKPQRRQFTAKYKARILKQFDALAEPGARGTLLRHEGLYTSHICHWRKNAKLQGGLDRQRGRKPVPAEQREVERLRHENEKLTERLRKAEKVIEVQKNVYALLRSLVPESNNQGIEI
jgi:transposase-like protein